MRAWRRGSSVAAFYGVLAIVLSWPVALHWRTRIPIGVEPAGTVPFFNLWTLRWNAHAFGGFGAHLDEYWNAPIFHPLHDSFARSEAQPLTGFVFWLVRNVVGDVGAYNVVILAFLALNGVAGYALARRLRAPFGAALACGALAQGLPFVWNQFGVLQLVPLFPLIFAVERWLAFRERPSAANALLIGLAYAVTDLTSGYYAVFLGLMALVMVPVLVWRYRGVTWSAVLGGAALSAAVLLLCTGVYAASQQVRTEGFRWRRYTVTALSGRPSDWIQREWSATEMPWGRTIREGHALFPGAFFALLALVGLVAAWRSRERRVVVATIVGVALMVAFSGGLRWDLFGWRPYSTFYDHVPGFDRLRSPFRFGVAVQIVLLMPVACALRRLWEVRARALVVTITILSLAETTALTRLDASTIRVPDTAHADWVAWLRGHPGGAVAMVPFSPGSGEVDYEATTVGMLAGLDHGHPLVNGYSGFFPRAAIDLRADMTVFPDRFTVDALHGLGVRYVVVDRTWLDETRTRALPAWDYRVVFAGLDKVVYAQPGT